MEEVPCSLAVWERMLILLWKVFLNTKTLFMLSPSSLTFLPFLDLSKSPKYLLFMESLPPENHTEACQRKQIVTYSSGA